MPEIFGDPLPHSIGGWLVLFPSILAALLVVLQTAEEFAKRIVGGPEKINRRYGGLAFPLGWATWSVMLLIGRHDVVAVLVVLLGTLTFTIAAQRLAQKCKQ